MKLNEKIITVSKPCLPPYEEYIKFLEKIWSSRWLTNNGEFVQLLQRRLKKYLKVRDISLVTNGTLALQIALKALDLQGEVITTPFTFPATTNVILWEGLVPVFADIDPETFNLDPKDVEKKITKKTSAILATHLYGNPCYVEELEEISDEHNLKLIFDAAHAFGVKYKNGSILNYGDISTLSFHATKVFHTIEGGAIITKNKQLFEKLQLLRDHGIKSEEEVVLPGINAKMNEFQAVMGLCNLEEIEEKNRSRKMIYKYYKKKLSDIGNVRFQKIIASRYNYSFMPICFKKNKERDEIYSELIRNGIKPRRYFYPLIANLNYFKDGGLNLVEKYNLRMASDVASKILCLPLYPDLKVEVVDNISDIIREFFR